MNLAQLSVTNALEGLLMTALSEKLTIFGSLLLPLLEGPNVLKLSMVLLLLNHENPVM